MDSDGKLAGEIFRYPFLETALPGFCEYLIDEDGRPLAEANASAGLLHGVELRFETCPYPGSRLGAPMNVSALRQVTSCWAECLEDFDALRAIYMQSFPMEMNYLLLSRLGNFLTTVPGFLARRKAFAWNAVPRRLSALFKVAQGLYLTANAVMLAGPPEVAFEPARVDDVLKATEERGIYLNEGRVCAGSPAMIRAFVDRAISGRKTGAGAPPDASRLAGAAPQAALHYCELTTQAQMAKWVFDAYLDDVLGLTDPGSDNLSHQSLQSLNRQSGLRLAPPGEGAGRIPLDRLLPLMKTDTPEARAAARRAADLTVQYAGYLTARQTRVNAALGTGEPGRFSWRAHMAAVGHHAASERFDRLERLVDMRKFAELVDAAV
ncbi:hypothetical protein [Stappia sp. TSB10P1A]|uniref:hypothetical protein n=1 Tax=Stappia sp. TSB10P1A TaxID=2003585 RepID=UPI001643B7CC|nr:hypothetical protein [Stappia sp. TSB10P1A]